MYIDNDKVIEALLKFPLHSMQEGDKANGRGWASCYIGRVLSLHDVYGVYGVLSATKALQEVGIKVTVQDVRNLIHMYDNHRIAFRFLNRLVIEEKVRAEEEAYVEDAVRQLVSQPSEALVECEV